MKKLFILLLSLASFVGYAQTNTEISNILAYANSSIYITGQGSQTAINQNIILATAGSGSYDLQQLSGIILPNITIQIVPASGTVTAGVITFEGSNDNFVSTALPLLLYDLNSLSTAPVSTVTLAASTPRYFGGSTRFRYIRARISTAITGTTTGVQAFTLLKPNEFVQMVQTVNQPTAANLNVTLGSGTLTTLTTLTTLANGQTAHSSATTGSPLRIGGRVAPTTAATQDATLVAGDASDINVTTGRQLIVKQYETAENDWHYAAAASGIVSTTTAVTFKAASGTANIRNYITSVDIGAIGAGTATELCIRDGAAGTVIWRMQIPAAGFTFPLTINFTTPLKGTANTLLEVVTLTSSATPVYFNAHGYTGF